MKAESLNDMMKLDGHECLTIGDMNEILDMWLGS